MRTSRTSWVSSRVRPEAPRAVAGAALEIVAVVAAATAWVAALQSTAPATGTRRDLPARPCSVIAIRRGERAALVAAVLSVLTLNYLFITPRHRLDDRPLAGRRRAGRADDRRRRRRPARGDRSRARSRGRAPGRRRGRAASARRSCWRRRRPRSSPGTACARSSTASAAGSPARPARADARVVLEPVPVARGSDELALPLRARTRHRLAVRVRRTRPGQPARPRAARPSRSGG